MPLKFRVSIDDWTMSTPMSCMMPLKFRASFWPKSSMSLDDVIECLFPMTSSLDPILLPSKKFPLPSQDTSKQHLAKILRNTIIWPLPQCNQIK